MKNKCASMLLASLCLGVLLTGCGKAPDSGENTAPVQAAKQDVRKLTLESLRSQIGLVQQDVYLFCGSIRENIAYGKPGASMEEIIDAAKKRCWLPPERLSLRCPSRTAWRRRFQGIIPFR